MRKKSVIFGALAISLCLGALPVSASPSIDNLQADSQQTVSVLDDGESPAARALTRTEIYCSQAQVEQYLEKDAQGNTVETKMSQMIAASRSVTEETGSNGRAISDEIPTVRQLVEFLGQPEQTEYDLDRLEQLTYMMDLKYSLTGQRIAVGSRLPGKAFRMRDGKITLTVDGGEVLRSGNIQDFVIFLADDRGENSCFLKMKEYDSETGVYTVELPYIGSFMVMQIMDR